MSCGMGSPLHNEKSSVSDVGCWLGKVSCSLPGLILDSLRDAPQGPLVSFHRCLMLTITSPATCRYTPEPDHSCAKSAAKASARPARCADTKLSTPRYVAPGRAPARAQHPVPERRHWGEEGQGFPLLLLVGRA